jgi:Family of unknown function (DUF6069)
VTAAYPPNPVASPMFRLSAGRLWAGGLATALVAALIATVGVLVVRGLGGVPLLAPRGSGLWGDDGTAWYVAGAALGALVATAVMHLLATYAPRPVRFFGWIVFLVTTMAALVPFLVGMTTAAAVAVAAINVVIGVAIGSLVAGSARSAMRYPPGPAYPYGQTSAE